MKVSDVVAKFGLTVFSGEQGLGNEILGGYVSDLLSDVMGNSKEGQLWITLQTHENVVAIASLKDLAAIVLVNNNVPDEESAVRSNEEGIPILGTALSAFEITGKIYNEI